MEFGAETETTPQGRMTSACLQVPFGEGRFTA
jgi:hypothetical protein